MKEKVGTEGGRLGGREGGVGRLVGWKVGLWKHTRLLRSPDSAEQSRVSQE